jgi:hypothetical protein
MQAPFPSRAHCPRPINRPWEGFYRLAYNGSDDPLPGRPEATFRPEGVVYVRPLRRLRIWNGRASFRGVRDLAVVAWILPRKGRGEATLGYRVSLSFYRDDSTCLQKLFSIACQPLRC